MITRREFVGYWGAAAVVATNPPAGLSLPPPKGKKRSVTLKTSWNAYSFNKLLSDAIRGRGEGVTLVQVLEFAANNKFEGFDPTGYFFPGYPAVPADAYVDNLKKR